MMSITDKLLKAAPQLLETLEAEYRRTVKLDFQNCPIKYCQGLHGDLAAPYRYINFMSAKLSNGFTATKQIMVDELSGLVLQNLELYDPQGKWCWMTTDPVTTYYRCGLMAALCMKLYFGEDWKNQSVGFVGWGKINKVTRDVLNSLEVKSDYPLLQKDGNPAHLHACDIIIACTNNFDLEKRHKASDFKKAKLIITQDGEWTIDSVGVARTEFSDHPEQLESQIDHEFPGEEMPFTCDNLLGLERKVNSLAICYLHGLAVADAVVAHYLYEER